MKVYVQQIFRVMRNAYKLKDRGSNLLKKKNLCVKKFLLLRSIKKQMFVHSLIFLTQVPSIIAS